MHQQTPQLLNMTNSFAAFDPIPHGHFVGPLTHSQVPKSSWLPRHWRGNKPCRSALRPSCLWVGHSIHGKFWNQEKPSMKYEFVWNNGELHEIWINWLVYHNFPRLTMVRSEVYHGIPHFQTHMESPPVDLCPRCKGRPPVTVARRQSVSRLALPCPLPWRRMAITGDEVLGTLFFRQTLYWLGWSMW